MKRLETILEQDPVFSGDWGHLVDMVGEFEGINMGYEGYTAETSPYANTEAWETKKTKMNMALEEYQGINIIYAWYEYANYSGAAFVLFEKGGELFEVNGSHCSCYGLEGQWGPEETSLEAIEHRIKNGDSYSLDEYKSELAKVLGVKL